MAKSAFIFDLDGVIIDSENWWDKIEGSLPGHNLGQSINSSFSAAKIINPKLTFNNYLDQLNRWAKEIYTQAPLAKNIDQLLTWLIKNQYKLAIVSGSTTAWIKTVLSRLHHPIPLIISLHDHPEYKPKPAPDGYLEAMKQLRVEPKNTLILEDSQLGIDSAKASGAFTICLTEHHPKNYSPPGADLYVKNIKELLVYLDSVQL